MKEIFQEFKKIKARVLENKPLVHHLTNYVTANDCANVCLCFGASPVMADAIEEMESITGVAKALVINFGTINTRTYSSMKEAVLVAKKNNIPVIFDPVGVMASAMRVEMAKEILALGVTIIRGNYAECTTLLGDNSHGKGVDSDATIDGNGALAKKVAETFHCVVAVTGKEDAISDGKRTIIGKNGCDMLSKVTGTGCMTTTLVAAAAGETTNYLAAALYGITTMNVAAEKALSLLEKNEGPGTFRVRLLDQIYLLTSEEICQGFRGVEV